MNKMQHTGQPLASTERSIQRFPLDYLLRFPLCGNCSISPPLHSELEPCGIQIRLRSAGTINGFLPIAHLSRADSRQLRRGFLSIFQQLAIVNLGVLLVSSSLASDLQSHQVTRAGVTTLSAPKHICVSTYSASLQRREHHDTVPTL